MLFIALLAIFGAASLATSALAYDERRWRYAAGVTVASGVILAAWSAKLLVAAAANQVSWDIHPLVAVLIAVVPYAVVVSNLWARRRHTPRHAPGIDDDPVLRRHVAEKRRRSRLQRQAEADEAAADDSSFT